MLLFFMLLLIFGLEHRVPRYSLAQALLTVIAFALIMPMLRYIQWLRQPKEAATVFTFFRPGASEGPRDLPPLEAHECGYEVSFRGEVRAYGVLEARDLALLVELNTESSRYGAHLRCRSHLVLRTDMPPVTKEDPFFEFQEKDRLFVSYASHHGFPGVKTRRVATALRNFLGFDKKGPHDEVIADAYASYLLEKNKHILRQKEERLARREALIQARKEYNEKIAQKQRSASKS